MSDFFSVIRDYEKYPEFLDEMESVRIIRSEGGVSDVEFTLNVIKRITYTLRLTESPGGDGLRWELVEGMFKSNSGGWALESLPDGRTGAVYDVEVAVGIFVPGSIVNRLVGKTLPATLKAFKRRAESL
jgi:ribosome-associated toxin RatA of RatAB toxin-antitoxin module